MKGESSVLLGVAILLVLALIGTLMTLRGRGDNQPACTITELPPLQEDRQHFIDYLQNKLLIKIDTISESDYEEVYPGSEVISRESPRENTSTHTVTYFWCKNELFTYENYLSVISVVKTIKPMKIKFYYTSYPRVDDRDYFSWFKDVLTIPYFVTEKLPENHRCQYTGVAKLETVVTYLKTNGGLYVGEETIIASMPTHVLEQEQITLLPDLNRLHTLLSNSTHTRMFQKHLNGVIGLQGNRTVKTEQTDSQGCCLVEGWSAEMPDRCLCVILVLDHVLYPKYFWDLDNQLGRLFRYIAYGTTDILKPVQDFKTLAPRFSHYIWFGKREFDFSHYLSVLSAIHVAGLKRVFFHGTIEPYGEYWERVTSEEDVSFIQIDLPETVFSSQVRDPSHANDVVKMYILHLYGGVHQDPDVYWLNFISDDELAYDSMMGFEWLQAGYWPETFNIGVFIAKKGSKFIKEFAKTLKDYQDDRWIYNSALMTYRTYERMPGVLFADRHLQILCFIHRCHPPWTRDYNIYNLYDVTPDAPFDWRNEALTIHNTIPKPYKELSSLEKLLNSSGMFADVGRFILIKSGRLDDNDMKPISNMTSTSFNDSLH